MSLSQINSLIMDFLEHLEIEKGCSPLTIRNYHHYLRRFSGWFATNMHRASPRAITLDTIRMYRLHLARLRSSNGKPLSPVTQSYHVVALRAFLRYLVAQRDISTLSPDKIHLPKRQDKSVVFLDTSQLDRLTMAPNVGTPIGLRDRAILETLFSTGLRVSELTSLNRAQMDLKRGEFGVVGKGSRPRVVFLSESASYWLSRYLGSRRDDFEPVFIRYSGRVDGRGRGERMRLTPRSVERIVKRYATKCSLPVRTTPHTIRHSFATDLLIGGADLRSVQEMLGHQSVRTTQVYTHVTNRQLREVHRRFHSRKRGSHDA